VIPAGALNHFAADLGVGSARGTLATLRNGEAVQTDLGLAGDRPFVSTSSTGRYVDLVNARRQLEGALGKRLPEIVALVRVLRRGRPARAGPGREAPAAMALLRRATAGTSPRDGARVPSRPGRRIPGHPCRRGHRAAGSRLVAAVLTGTLGRSRVYRSWRASSVGVRAANGKPIWLSTDGEVATAESGFVHGKHPHALVVYRKAGG
jgi:hypothetical protein